MRRWISRLTYIVLVLVVLLLLVILVVPISFQQKAAVVLSSSMEPALPRGALAFTRSVEAEEVEVGDIIAFSPEEDSDITTSHRVIEIVLNNGELSFRTKGDANEDADPLLVPADYIRGKVVFHIPGLGRMTNWALRYVRTWPGFVILVVLPALAIVGTTYREINRRSSLKKRRMDLLKKRREQYQK